MLEAKLTLEKMSKEQELQKREKEITAVRKELEREKQKPPAMLEV